MADKTTHDQFIQHGHVSMVVGGQFGSEAKGLVAAYIANKINEGYKGPLVSTTNAGAQAGHTTILKDGTKFVCYHLPTAGVLVKQAQIYLNAGSIIDPDLLNREITSVSAALGVDRDSIIERLTIHPHATIITDDAKDVERSGKTAHLGSTQKGVGAALANKIMRDPGATVTGWMKENGYSGVTRQGETIEALNLDMGTGLSINSSGFYPKTTSRECWVGQALVDVGLHPRSLGIVSMVVRTFPIRVGHIWGNTPPGAAPMKLGDSGPFYEDGAEIEWEDLPGVEPERTTVTQRVRRIAKWSSSQYVHALRLNRPENVFLTFTNYCTEAELRAIVHDMRETERRMMIQVAHFYSWGPRVDQVSRVYSDAAAHCRVA